MKAGGTGREGGERVCSLSGPRGLGASSTHRSRRRGDGLRLAFLSGCLAGALTLAGCGGSPEGPASTGLLDGLFAPPVAEAPPAPPRTRDLDKTSCGSAAQCSGVLKTMIESPDRGWIGKQQAPSTYANGTRLFAYRALRTKLTCSELALAVDEVRAASKSLGRPVQGMAADQLSRTRDLSTQVEGELSRERTGRCRT